MLKKEIIVKIHEGVDVEYAGRLAIVAERFQCKSMLQLKNHTINMHSLLNLVSVGICRGDKVTVICDGCEEQQAMQKYEKILSGLE